jgi:hypothetical protein
MNEEKHFFPFDRGSEIDNEKHGSPRDRGSADAYYGRPFDPHYWSEGTYQGTRTEMKDMTTEEIVEYTKGYNQEQDRKNWGDENYEY